jgi:hypothetical protein
MGLALLVVVGSVGVFYFAKSNQHNPYPPFGALVATDSLIDNSQGYEWDEHPTDNLGGACQFAGGAYHASASNAHYGSFYMFTVCQNGSYTLWSGYSNTLRDNASSAAIHTGLNQSNLIAIVANGSTLDL